MAPIKRRYRVLPLFASPLEDYTEHQNHGHGSDSEASSISGKEGVTEAARPKFRESEEASSIELFYDLFFVANLTSFTGIHSIDEPVGMLIVSPTSHLNPPVLTPKIAVKSYIGFFALLWFNWLQVTLYDCRFSVDSVFERVCKGLHLGVMIAFAVVGTQFDTSATAKYAFVFQQFSVIMMVSKIILLFQYGYVLFWVRGQSKIIIPLLIHMVAYTVGAIICLGVVFSFDKERESYGYLAWYAIALVEALAVFISSSRWRSVSFKRTHLNERVGLLTLIILGEGIIVLAKSMNYVTRAENYSPAVTGQIISSTLIIVSSSHPFSVSVILPMMKPQYFLYMLYFDQVDTRRFGTIRQQFWALAHFPFHVALVLFLEGTSRFVTWRNAIESVVLFIHDVDVDLQSSNTTVQAAQNLQSRMNVLVHRDPDLATLILAESAKSNINSSFNALAASVDVDSEQALKAIGDIVGMLLRSIVQFFNLKAPKKDTPITFTGPTDPFSYVNSVFHVYDLVFVYFFVAAGCTLLMMSVLIALAKKNKCLGDYVVITLRAVVGIGLASIVALKGHSPSMERFIMSPWILPTVMLALGLVVLLDGVFGYLLPAAPIPTSSSSSTSESGDNERLQSGKRKKYGEDSFLESDDEV